MSTSDSWKLLVFRDGSTSRDGQQLLSALLDLIRDTQIVDFDQLSGREPLLEALLRAGEFECALADSGYPAEYVSTAASLTDALAFALLRQRAPQIRPETLSYIAANLQPGSMTVSAPEGFSYYALHPLDYADLLSAKNLRVAAAAVVGIRSIGTTLSAIVRGWFESQGVTAERICVRPAGPHFDRRLDFTDVERAWISRQLARSATFMVVDEGPGLSGSSFLAVAEALQRAGAPERQIVLMPSSEPDLGALIAPNAAQRWRKFETIPLQATRHIPQNAVIAIGAGQWRKHVIQNERDWPAVWSWTERQKYLSPDKQKIFRFDGYGHYGCAVRARSQALAEAGWGPAAEDAGDGFTRFPWVHGSRTHVANTETIKMLARYCAFRADTFAAEVSSQSALQEMTFLNLERAAGVTLANMSLIVERPVIADGRMMPYEWVKHMDGRWMKLDASSHGDDHFYPGPCDIAWDVAGAIVEWDLNSGEIELLARDYSRLSGDQISKRLHAYQISYCAFRLGFTLSAALSAEASEQPRFRREAEFYRDRLSRVLHLSTSA